MHGKCQHLTTFSLGGEPTEVDGFSLFPKRRFQEEEGESGIPDSTGQVDKGTNSVKIDQRAAWKEIYDRRIQHGGTGRKEIWGKGKISIVGKQEVKY